MTKAEDDCIIRVVDVDGRATVQGAKRYSKGAKVANTFGDHDFDDGAWVDWEWDGTCLTAHTSPHGMMPLYYRQTRDGIALSTRLDGLLFDRDGLHLDYRGMSVLLRLGNFLGDRTPFEEIKVVPPNATLRWSAGSLTIRARDLAHSARVVEIDRDRAIDQYIELLCAAVRRRLPEDAFVVPVSAGRDSRHILFELLANGRRPVELLTSAHYRLSSKVETRIARMLAEATGLPLRIIQVPHDQVAAQTDVTRRTDYCVIDHYWGSNVTAAVSNYAVSYDGLNGGVLFGRTRGRPKMDGLYRAGKLEELADLLLKDNEVALRGMLGDEALERMPRDLAMEAMVGELEKWTQSSNPLVSFLHHNHVRRRTSYFTYRMIETPTVFCPLDDFNVVDFALTLPPAIANDPSLQGTACRKAFPRYADLPFEEELKGQWRKSDDAPVRIQGLTLANQLMRLESSTILDRRWLFGRCASAMLKGGVDTIEWWIKPAVYLTAFSRFLAQR